MARKIDWESQLGRRLRLRDLHVFYCVVQQGNMARAATYLGVTPATISESIADLEYALGVKLLERNPQGIEPTTYGRALLRGTGAAFDDLRQSIKEIEFLADPTVGVVRLGCPETVAAILPPIIQSLSRRHPGIALQISDVIAPTLHLPALRNREIDLALVRIAGRPERHPLGHDLDVEVLLNDSVLVVVGGRSRWANERRVGLSDLANERWILPTTESLQSRLVLDSFRQLGLRPPKITVVTFSVQLRMDLIAEGHYVGTLPRSVVRRHSKRWSLKALPALLPAHEFPLAIVTLKNRTLNSAVHAFIEHSRAIAKEMELQVGDAYR